MKNVIDGLTILILSLTISTVQAQKAEQLIDEMITALGGKQNFYNLKNVTYEYTYNNPKGPKMVSKETYVFDGELSHAIYTEHTQLGKGVKLVEGFDGQQAWAKDNGKLLTDEKAISMARFKRKTNYYWFTMFFKLQDEGLILSYEGGRQVEGRLYDLVKVTFKDQIGDAKDTYLLYINQRTKLVDQFLFTVASFGKMEPFLMRVRYETIDGIKIPSDHVYISANCDGEIIGDMWATALCDHIQFNTEIDQSLFSK